CGEARRSEPIVGSKPPTGPIVSSGQVAFMHFCNQCHPGGAAGLGPSINNKPLPPAMIKMQVRHGLGVMPAFSEQQIPDDQLDAIVAYLKWLRELPPHNS